ncbi:MAG: tripartite tricarboxylate transporter substrate binding protein [Burkholderiales bacterium]|nr:tripartite tricarboxylate transporter substrate binding protein [Burkholderiales bacterium]
MILRKRRLIAQAGAGMALAIAAALGAAQSYPARSLVMVVPYAPGGAVDLVGRVTAAPLSERLGHNIAVENVGGASGTIGTAKVVGARPDGYTLLMGSGSEISIAKLLNPNVSYDGERDLAPVSLVGTAPMLLVGGSKLKAGTLDDLLAIARARPGQLTYASPGIGSPLHLAGELVKMRGGVDIAHVPYKGSGPAMTDLLGGQIDLAVAAISTALPHVNSGKLKAFGVTEAKRSPVAPNIPALAENKSLQGVDIGVWYGLFAPAKTPAAIVERLHKEVVEALKNTKLAATLGEQGISIAGSTPAELRQFIRNDTEKYRKIVQSANIRLE